MSIRDLPALNATLNGCAALMLILGWHAIACKKDPQRHRFFMIAAFIFSTLFLGFYLLYHYHVGSVSFPDLGWIKTVYLMVLFTHIVGAIVMVPMIFTTFFYAFAKKNERHKKWARKTLPLWLYVSVTGVLIYFALYHWFIPGKIS